jgi:hypothetical protein
LNLTNALESGLKAFYKAYDQYVKNDLPPRVESFAKVGDLVNAANGSNGQEASPAAN